LKVKTSKMISETEPARLAQWFLSEPLKRMGGSVSLPPANGLGLLVPLPKQGTDSRLCGAHTLACGGKHADEITATGIDLEGCARDSDPVRPRAKGSLSAAPALADAPGVGTSNQNKPTIN